MRARIIYTRYDGGVSICTPTVDVISWMGCGGYWADHPRGFLDIQIERQVEAGHTPYAARRFAHALQFGGCTTAEALEIIRDRDCGHLGTGFEIWDRLEIPSDRWFRDAWHRSHNGGPIGIDMNAARVIQWKRIRAAANVAKVELKAPWKARIRRAATPEHLKSIWPKFLKEL